jgi:Mor family transcriptional regulator
MKMSKYDFIKEVENASEHLTGDEKYFIENYGHEAFIGLYETFAGNTVYFSEVQINKLRKVYIRQFYNGENVRELSRKLNVSDSFVRQAAKELFTIKEENRK